MKKIRQFSPKRILRFQTKILLENYFFVKIMFFFHFFSLLSYLFSVSLLKICCRNLKSLIWKPNKKFCGGIFFLKLCSFVIFADIEFPSDFQRSFSTGLPKLYPECSVERYQQRDIFREISYLLHVFGLSVKKSEDRWRKSFARASNEKFMYLDDCLRKQTLVDRKTLSSFFELSEKKVREIDEIISAVFFRKSSTFPEKIFARKFFFVKIMFFFTIFRHWFICSPSLCWNFAEWISKIWSENPTKILWKNLFFNVCSFVIFADIEFPSDFRRSFSTGLPKLYPECWVERYQQKHTFREFSNFLHVFGLSVKKMRSVGEKPSQELQMRNLCI